MINQQHYFEALVELGYESFSIETDGTVWIGTEDDKVFIDPEVVVAKVQEIESRSI